jgi:hypothetical protein
MSGKFIDLSAAQKEEIRRLTQLANRRIKAADRAYRKEGLEIIPREIAGDYQIREKWTTSTTPISRSVKFTSQKEYRQQLQFLRSFEVGRPGIKEYTRVQQEKVLDAIETSLGVDVPKDLVKRVGKMSAPQMSDFWNAFSDKASKLGIKYASDKAMAQTIAEFFPEDLTAIAAVGKR